jgi:hypothetical protein
MDDVNPPDVSLTEAGVGFTPSNDAWAVGKDFVNHKGDTRLSEAPRHPSFPNISTDWGFQTSISFFQSGTGRRQDVTNNRA